MPKRCNKAFEQKEKETGRKRRAGDDGFHLGQEDDH